MLERDEFRLKRSGSLLPRPTRAGLSHMEFSMSRPCERRDPSVSAIALIAEARTLVSALEKRLLFTSEARVMGPCVRRDDPLRAWTEEDRVDRSIQLHLKGKSFDYRSDDDRHFASH